MKKFFLTGGIKVERKGAVKKLIIITFLMVFVGMSIGVKQSLAAGKELYIMVGYLVNLNLSYYLIFLSVYIIVASP